MPAARRGSRQCHPPCGGSLGGRAGTPPSPRRGREAGGEGGGGSRNSPPRLPRLLGPLLLLVLLARAVLGGFGGGGGGPPAYYYQTSTYYESRTVGQGGTVETVRRESFRSNVPGLAEQRAARLGQQGQALGGGEAPSLPPPPGTRPLPPYQ